MGYLDTLRKQLHRYSLRKALKSLKVQRKSVNFERAKSVGIQYVDTTPDRRKAIERYAESLRKKGKQVTLIAYVPKADASLSIPHKHFTEKELTFSFTPKSSEVKQFMQQEFDILIDVHQGDCTILEYMAALSRAHLRVGPFTDKTYCYDLLIDTSDKSDINHYLAQVDYFLKIFNQQPSHESPTA